jgi:hypothetical protein
MVHLDRNFQPFWVLSDCTGEPIQANGFNFPLCSCSFKAAGHILKLKITHLGLLLIGLQLNMEHFHIPGLSNPTSQSLNL